MTIRQVMVSIGTLTFLTFQKVVNLNLHEFKYKFEQRMQIVRLLERQQARQSSMNRSMLGYVNLCS